MAWHHSPYMHRAHTGLQPSGWEGEGGRGAVFLTVMFWLCSNQVTSVSVPILHAVNQHMYCLQLSVVGLPDIHVLAVSLSSHFHLINLYTTCCESTYILPAAISGGSPLTVMSWLCGNEVTPTLSVSTSHAVNQHMCCLQLLVVGLPDSHVLAVSLSSHSRLVSIYITCCESTSILPAAIGGGSS